MCLTVSKHSQEYQGMTPSSLHQWKRLQLPLYPCRTAARSRNKEVLGPLHLTPDKPARIHEQPDYQAQH